MIMTLLPLVVSPFVALTTETAIILVFCRQASPSSSCRLLARLRRLLKRGRW